MDNKTLVYRGSVKDIYKDESTENYIFEFSDRYSIFDWGEMPDKINQKGEALAFMANSFFKILNEEENINHHGIGMMNAAGEMIAGDSLTKLFAVTPVQIIRPRYSQETNEWDYSAYIERPSSALVPLEVIFRYGVPEGSSLLKRAGDLDYCKTLGLKSSPKAGDVFDKAVIEFSTKLETTDRYIDYGEAQRISGMNDEEFNKIIQLTKVASNKLKSFFEELGVQLWDGKFEYAFGEDRDLVMVDSIGPDELRLTFNGVQLSKETLRKFYRGSEWEMQIEKAKKIAKDRGTKDWKDICINELKSNPVKLDASKVQSISEMYKAISNAISQKLYKKDIFENTWDLKKISEVLQ